MKLIALFTLALLTMPLTAMACPDFSGQYQFAKAAWNGTIRIEQTGCTSVSVIQTKNVPVTVANPSGKLITTQKLKLNGRAYVGIENSTQRADENSTWFQKVTLENERLVFRQYSGAQKKCKNSYSSTHSDCHLVVYSLNHEEQSDDYTWIQTGVWWTEGGAPETQVYVLHKAPAQWMTSVAQN